MVLSSYSSYWGLFALRGYLLTIRRFITDLKVIWRCPLELAGTSVALCFLLGQSYWVKSSPFLLFRISTYQSQGENVPIGGDLMNISMSSDCLLQLHYGKETWLNFTVLSGRHNNLMIYVFWVELLSINKWFI